MTSRILATGLGGTSFKTVLDHGFNESKPLALGVAVAYVSVAGLEYVQKLVDKHKVAALRLVTDTTDAITHPIALGAALDNGWEVRVINHLSGTFHPKLYIGGTTFDAEAGMTGVSLIVAGSANLTGAALYRNGECSYLSEVDPIAGTRDSRN
jgi:HKD family nuclease